MKKVIIVIIVLILIITVSFMLLGKKSSTEEKIEIDLAKSMEETNKEKEKINELLRRIPQEVNDKGFGQIGLSYSPDNRIFTVQAKDEDFIKRNKGNVENIIVNSTKEIDFENFEVDFIALDSYGVVSQGDHKLSELNEIFKMSTDLLKENGYDDFSYSVEIDPQKEIIIEVTNEDMANKDEMEKLITNSIFSKTNMSFAVKLRKKSEGEIREQEWQPVISTIIEETEKEFEEYRGFAYSFHPEPLQIIIKTKIETPKWFRNSDKKANKIANYVDKIIELKREELSIEEIPYKIIIKDKNNKEMKYRK